MSRQGYRDAFAARTALPGKGAEDDGAAAHHRARSVGFGRPPRRRTLASPGNRHRSAHFGGDRLSDRSPLRGGQYSAASRFRRGPCALRGDLRFPPRPPHRCAERAGDRIPERGDRESAAQGGGETGLPPGRPSPRALCRGAGRSQAPERREQALMVLPEIARDKPVEIRAGDIELRLAESEAEIRAAQALRYRVFYEEMAAKPTAEMSRLRRDFDSFDEYCDHILMIDHAIGPGAAGVVGTYRLLRRSAADRRGQFYSVDEYDISKLLALPGEILELGRSCIAAGHRQRSIMALLWRGIADYVLFHDIGV